MKSIKFLIVFISMLFVCAPALADVMPYYTEALSKQTMGFAQVPPSFSLYAAPNANSQVVEVVNWNHYGVQFKNYTIDPSEMFATLLDGNKFALCMVIDTQDDWYKIIYDKKRNKSAWVKLKSEEDFWGLKDFYSLYGMQYGLYYMKNIDYRKRGIYSAPQEGAQKLDGFTLIQTIRLNKLSGNWALVTVVDFDSKPKIGYIRWREDDGTIVIFPKLGE